MNSKEDSSFLQGIESRLDSLFGEVSAPVKEEKPVAPEPAAEVVAAEDEAAFAPKDEISEISVQQEVSPAPADMPSDKAPPQDKSTFISEIEKRFSAIFGEDDKERRAPSVMEKEPEAPMAEAMTSAEPVVVPPEEAPLELQAETPVDTWVAPKVERPVEPAFEPAVVSALPPQPPQEVMEREAVDSGASVSSILRSPLKDIKSIILSIEWEIDDDILGQFDDEVNKLYLLYTGDRIVQGFLRILRFLGRYIRVRGLTSSQDSINLLLSIYDHLETVMISEGMTEARKQVILVENIKKYKRWVKSTDLEAGVEETVHEVVAPSVAIMAEEKPAEIKLAAQESASLVEQPAESMKEEPASEALSFAPPEVKPAMEAVAEEIRAEKPLPVMAGEAQQALIEAMKNMPPHEAFAYALEEMKKTFQTQLDALKEEIRVLKSSR